MKKVILLVAFCILAIGLVTGCAGGRGNALAINDIQTDPFSFAGEITINGVNVGALPQDPNIFFLMDTAELIACKNMQCGAFQLPVVYKGGGSMPQVADEVNVTGSWGKYEVEGENGMESVDVFEISSIDVKRNIMNLLQ